MRPREVQTLFTWFQFPSSFWRYLLMCHKVRRASINCCGFPCRVRWRKEIADSVSYSHNIARFTRPSSWMLQAFTRCWRRWRVDIHCLCLAAWVELLAGLIRWNISCPRQGAKEGCGMIPVEPREQHLRQLQPEISLILSSQYISLVICGIPQGGTTHIHKRVC